MAEQGQLRLETVEPSCIAHPQRALIALPRQMDSAGGSDDLGRDKRALSFLSSAVTLAQSWDTLPSFHFCIQARHALGNPSSWSGLLCADWTEYTWAA